MQTYEPITVQMDYKSRSKILQNIQTAVWDWGQTKIPKNKEGKVIGATAPLWLNESKMFFIGFSILFFFTSLLLVGSYVFFRFYNRDKENSGLLVRNYTMLEDNVTYDEFLASTNSTNVTGIDLRDVYCMYISYNKINSIFILIGGIILFINFSHMAYLGCFVEYGSDKEWSRNLTCSAFILVLLSIFTIGDIIYSASLISYYNKNQGSDTSFIFNLSTSKCNSLFQVNMIGYLIVGIVTGILVVFQSLKLIALGKKYFLEDYVVHTARCEDENILVI